MSTIAETFDDHWVEDPATRCWIWLRAQAGKYAKYNRGYGCLRVNGVMTRAHIFAYERAHGPVPEGMHLLHSCDTPFCVNPQHTHTGTNAKNMEEKAQRGLAPSRLTAEQVMEIRARCAAGEFQRVVAEDYDLNQGCVSHIVNWHYWRHV